MNNKTRSIVALAFFLLVLVCACGGKAEPDPISDPNSADPDPCATCSETETCVDGECLEECITHTCESLNVVCGEIDDGCGGIISCEFCPFGYDCFLDESECVDLCPPNRDLKCLLELIPDLSAEEIPTSIRGARAFHLKLRQPQDHFDSHIDQSFKQSIILIHRNLQSPMVKYTYGYGISFDYQAFGSYLTEPAAILEANQITVEHRFYGESIPQDPDWNKLTIEQSAADSHRIVNSLSALYASSWIGTGISKGGMTALFHHRFYPEDLSGIVPYVAPISFGLEDTRYVEYLDAIGPVDAICRERVFDMASEVIERRDEFADYLIARYPEAKRMDYEHVKVVSAHSARNFHWNFWQKYGSVEYCSMLPPRDSPIDDLAVWFEVNPLVYLYTYPFDRDFGPYSFQTANQLGQPKYDYSHLSEALQDVPYEQYPYHESSPPWEIAPKFDPESMVDINEHLHSEADRILAIYGEWDPWSGGMMELNMINDNLILVAPGANHSAHLADLPRHAADDGTRMLMRWASTDRPKSKISNYELNRARDRLLSEQNSHSNLVDSIPTRISEQLPSRGRQACISEALGVEDDAGSPKRHVEEPETRKPRIYDCIDDLSR